MLLSNADLIKLPQEILDMIVPLLTRHDLTQVSLVSSSWFDFFSPYLWETVEIRNDKTMRRFVDSVKEGALIRSGHHIRTLDSAYYSVIEHVAKLGRSCTRLVKLSVESNLSSSTFGTPLYFSTSADAPLFGPTPADPSLFGGASAPTLFGAMAAPSSLFEGVPAPSFTFGSRPAVPTVASVPTLSSQNTAVDTASSLVSTFESLWLSSGTQPETQPETPPETPPESQSGISTVSNFSSLTLTTSTSEPPTQLTANPGATTSTASRVRFGEPAFSSITRVIPGAISQSPPLFSASSTAIPPAGSQPAPFSFSQISPQTPETSTTLQASASQPTTFTFGQSSSQPIGTSTTVQAVTSQLDTLQSVAPRPPPFTFGTFSRTYDAPSFETTSASEEYTPPPKAPPPSCHDRSYLALVLQRNKMVRSLTVRGSLVSRVYARYPESSEVCMDRIFESLPETIETLVISRSSNPFTDPFADNGSCYGNNPPPSMSIGRLLHLRSLHVDSALNTQSLQEILMKCESLERLQLQSRSGLDMSVIAETLEKYCPLLCELNVSGPGPVLSERGLIDLLRASVGGWRTLSFHSVPFTLSMLDAILGYVATLENLLIDTLPLLASKEIQRLLCSAPRLKRLNLLPDGESLHITPASLDAEDMIDSKWACCDTLESLKLTIGKIPRPDLVKRTNGRPFSESEMAVHRRNFPTISERTVYDQLSKLKRLKELVLGFEERASLRVHERYNMERIEEGEYYDRNHSQYKLQYDCLGMSLETGMDMLKDLKEIRRLGLDKMAVSFDRAEEQAWVKKNWPKFDQVADDFWETRSRMK